MNLAFAALQFNPTLVLDIGANVGHWYKDAKQVWPDADFILVDGNEECRPALESLGVKFQIAVLSDIEKEVEFFTMRDCGTATGCSYYRENTPFFSGDNAVTHKIMTRTLDDIVELVPFDSHKSPHSILVKIDCQGAELDILKGGPKIISRAGALILELAHAEYNQGAPLAKDVIPYITNLGFVAVAKLEDIIHPLERDRIVQTTVMFRR